MNRKILPFVAVALFGCGDADSSGLYGSGPRRLDGPGGQGSGGKPPSNLRLPLGGGGGTAGTGGNGTAGSGNASGGANPAGGAASGGAPGSGGSGAGPSDDGEDGDKGKDGGKDDDDEDDRVPPNKCKKAKCK